MKSLLKPAIELTEEGVEAAKKEVGELANYFEDKKNKLFKVYEQAKNSSNKQEQAISQQLSNRFDVDEILKLTNTYLAKVAEKTTVDRNGNLRISKGGFDQAGKEAAEELNNMNATLARVKPTDLEILKDLDNIKSGEGGSKGVGNILDEVRQYFRVVVNPKSMSSEYMGSLGDQKRLTQVKAGAKTAGVGGSLLGVGATVNSLLSDEEGTLSKKQEKILKKYEELSNDPSEVVDIKAETMDKAFSMATSNPSKYIFIDEEGAPAIIYKGEKVPANLATNDKQTEIMLVPVKTKGKAEGGSTNDASKSDEALAEQVKYYKQLINAAKTPEEQQQVNKMFGDMLPVILREIQGGAGEELVPKSKYMGGRMDKNEGSLMMPPEMESDMPVDTYPNIPPEEMDEAMESQLPDTEMEDKYLDFVLDESLDDEEQSYLANALEADPKLSQIFDKVVTTASEFTGSGEVEGPGTGVSDSIPARLSDGEFVFTKKATDQMGADNLQVMMDDAERAYDGGMMREPANLGGLLSRDQDEDPMNYDKEMEDEEIQKGMLRANRAPSLMAG